MAVAVPAWSLVKRELLTTLRGWRPFLALLLFVVGGTLFAYGRWPATTDDVYMASWLSNRMIESMSLALFVASLVVVPAFAASAFVLERERATYDFLRLSLIRPGGIVTAKLLNAVGFFFLVLAGLAPVMSIAFFLIGVDNVEMLRILLVIVATAVSCASAGLLSSALARRSVVAIGLSYVGVVLLMIGSLIATYFVGAFVYYFADVRSVFGIVEDFRTVGSPIFTLLEVFKGIKTETFVWSLAYQAAFSMACLALTARLIRRPAKPLKIDETRPIDDAAALRQRRYGWPFYLIDPARRKKPIEDRRNPMFIREMRWGLLNRGTTLIRVFYVSFVVYFFAGAVGSLFRSSYETLGPWLLVQIVMTILIAPALTANAVTKEYELGNLDMLRMTLLRPRDLMVGKLLAAFISVTPLLAAASLSVGPVLLLGGGDWPIIGMGYGTLLVCTLLSLSLAMLCSLVARRTTVALVLTYVSSVVVFIGLAAVTLLVFRLLESGRYEVELARFGFLSPVLAFVYSAEVIEFRPGHPHVMPWAISMTGWLFVSLGFVAASVVLFSRYKMRDR